MLMISIVTFKDTSTVKVTKKIFFFYLPTYQQSLEQKNIFS